MGAGALALLLAEVAVRVLRPRPRAQPIEATGEFRLRWIDDVPLWDRAGDPRGHPDLACRAARPDAVDIVALGSSILYGVQLDAAQTWVPVAQRRLEEQGWSTCVHNISGPGWGAHQKQQALREVQQTLTPRVVLWELWGTDTLEYRKLGDRAWRMGELQTGPDGYPNPWALPLRANRLLFDGSALYRYANLAVTPVGSSSGDWPATLAGPVAEGLAAAEAVGGRLLLVVMPRLDRPFATSADQDRSITHPASQWLATVQGRPVRLVQAAALLREEEVEALRLDTCCHYDAEGHARLGEVLAAELAHELEALAAAAP